MLSTNERMERLKKRTKEIQSERTRKREKFSIALGYALCLIFIVGISYFVGSEMDFKRPAQIPPSGMASIFTDGYFFGYAVVGILAFLLGISVTVLCTAIHKRNKEKYDDGRAD